MKCQRGKGAQDHTVNWPGFQMCRPWPTEGHALFKVTGSTIPGALPWTFASSAGIPCATHPLGVETSNPFQVPCLRLSRALWPVYWPLPSSAFEAVIFIPKQNRTSRPLKMIYRLQAPNNNTWHFWRACYLQCTSKTTANELCNPP